MVLVPSVSGNFFCTFFRWCARTTGDGRLDGKEGCYHDAQHVKGNELDLTIHEIFGGFSPGAVRRLFRLARRAGTRARPKVDFTQYVSWTAQSFTAHWAQLISAAIVFGDARRSLDHVEFPLSKGEGLPAAEDRVE